MGVNVVKMSDLLASVYESVTNGVEFYEGYIEEMDLTETPCSHSLVGNLGTVPCWCRKTSREHWY